VGVSGRVPVPAVARGPRLPASTGRLVLLRRRLAGERRAGQTAAVLRVIGERPGVSARELADASQVTGGTLYSLLRRLADDGTLEKRELAGGQTGYALATSPAPEQSAAAASQTAPTDGTGVQAPGAAGARARSRRLDADR
jgi:hypothetical protein